MKKYHVYGLGNALLDSNIEISDSLLNSFNIKKGRMTLCDEIAHQQLIATLGQKFCYVGCGGSAANTIIALSQFGGRGFYSCKVADDDAGQLFIQELGQFGIDCNLSPQTLYQGITGRCLVLITEDSERTMHTHLGISETLCPKVLNFEAMADSEYIYLEGYLVASPTAKQALIEAKIFANNSFNSKVALTLSDPNIIRYFKQDLLSIIGDGVNLLFCNEEEALLFSETDDLEIAISRLKPLAEHLVITRGGQGAILVIKDQVVFVPTKPRKTLDSVGAGDMFAGAYLYAITHGYSPSDAVAFANGAAAEVVTQYGPRLPQEKILEIKKMNHTLYYEDREVPEL